MQEAHAIQLTCDFYMPRDTCQPYMWVVKNFLQTDL
jgi:hypothetical protein